MGRYASLRGDIRLTQLAFRVAQKQGVMYAYPELGGASGVSHASCQEKQRLTSSPRPPKSRGGHATLLRDRRMRRGAARTGTRRVGRLSPRQGAGWSSPYDTASCSLGGRAGGRSQSHGPRQARGRRRHQAALQVGSSSRQTETEADLTQFRKVAPQLGTSSLGPLRDGRLMRREEDRRGPKCRGDGPRGDMVQRDQFVRGGENGGSGHCFIETKTKVAPGIEPTRGPWP